MRYIFVYSALFFFLLLCDKSKAIAMMPRCFLFLLQLLLLLLLLGVTLFSCAYFSFCSRTLFLRTLTSDLMLYCFSSLFSLVAATVSVFFSLFYWCFAFYSCPIRIGVAQVKTITMCIVIGFCQWQKSRPQHQNFCREKTGKRAERMCKKRHRQQWCGWKQHRIKNNKNRK